MDVAATGAERDPRRVREPLDRPRGRGRAVSAGRGRVLPRDRRRRGRRSAHARSDDRRGAAEGWPLKRIEALLRAVLRAGAFELAARRDMPARVVISEYVDVANAFLDATRPAWSTPCSTSWRARLRAGEFAPQAARVSASARRSKRVSGEDELIARYFEPLATHPGALGLTRRRGALSRRPPGHELVLTKPTRSSPACISFPTIRRRDRAQGAAREPLRPRRQGRRSRSASCWRSRCRRARRGLARGLRARARRGRGRLSAARCSAATRCARPGRCWSRSRRSARCRGARWSRRSGAKAGDRVIVTGTIGDAALGLLLAATAKRASAGSSMPQATTSARSLSRAAAAHRAGRRGAHACVGRDGCLGRPRGDLAKLCRASGCRPRSRWRACRCRRRRSARARRPLIEPILTGGDDYEILCTVLAATGRRAFAAAAAAGVRRHRHRPDRRRRRAAALPRPAGRAADASRGPASATS